MSRTRVGYTGGAKINPTYHDLGDHTESVQVWYDPGLITYEELLDVFWNSHSARVPSFSRQYASLVFYHNEEQRRLAEAAKKRQEDRYGRIFTEILPAGAFYQAEQYHQKFYLSHNDRLIAALRRLYPTDQEYVDATVVARLNGYAAGHGSEACLLQELVSLGLSAEQSRELLQLAR